MRLSNQQIDSLINKASDKRKKEIEAEKKILREKLLKDFKKQAMKMAMEIKKLPDDVYDLLTKRNYSTNTEKSAWTVEKITDLLISKVDWNELLTTKELSIKQLRDDIVIASIDAADLETICQRLNITL